MWYVLAAANALSGDSELIAGTQLRVPEVGVSKNDASTFKPYNPNEIIGSTAPGLPYIAPPSSNGCGPVVTLVLTVIAVAVSAIVAPYITPYIAQAFGVTMPAAGAALASYSAAQIAVGAAGAFVGGMAGSIASQAVGSALGANSFSLRNAVSAGLSSGLSFGLTAGLGGSTAELMKGGLANAGKIAVSLVGNASIGYASNALAGVKGTSFSWKAIAANAVASGITAGIGVGMGNIPALKNGALSVGTIPGDFTYNAIGGIVSLHTRRAFGFNDKVDYGNIMASALGSAIGSGIGRAMQGGSFSGYSSSSASAKERVDWGLSRSQQEQLHQLPEVQQQVFFDQVAQGKQVQEALAAATVATTTTSSIEPVKASNEPLKQLDYLYVTARWNEQAGGYYVWNWNASNPGWNYTGQFVKTDRPVHKGYQRQYTSVSSETTALLSALKIRDFANPELKSLMNRINNPAGTTSRFDDPLNPGNQAEMRAVSSYDRQLLAQQEHLAKWAYSANPEQNIAKTMNNAAILGANGALGTDARGGLALSEAILVLNKNYQAARSIGTLGLATTPVSLGVAWLDNGNTQELKTDAGVQFTLFGISQLAEKSHNYVLWAAAAGTNALWNAYNHYKPDLSTTLDFMLPAQAPAGYFAPKYSVESQRAWLLQQGMNPEMSTWNRPVVKSGGNP